MALCYNFTRVLNILGFERFAACMEAIILALCQSAPAAVLRDISLVLETFRAFIVSRLTISRLVPRGAA